MPSPYASAIPGSPGYEDAALSAKTAYQNALARINSSRSATLRQYGYLGDVNPDSGVLSNVRVDPNNQFGGLQSMLRQQAVSARDAEYAAEDRGLHGGLANQAQSDLKYQAGADSAQLGSNLAGALGGFQDQQNQAEYSRDQALYQAELDAARLAIEQQSFSPADTSGVTDPGYGTDPGTLPDGGPGYNPPERQITAQDLGRGAPVTPAPLPPTADPRYTNTLQQAQSNDFTSRVINNLLNPRPAAKKSTKKKK